jgi:hypothetical protein
MNNCSVCASCYYTRNLWCAHDDGGCLAAFVVCSLQFERARASADELEHYLKAAATEAKEAEARALARADEGMFMQRGTAG